MRLVRLVSLVPFALLAACGGGNNNPVLVDSAVPDAIPVPPDAGPPDACPLDYCAADNACTNHDTDEQHCGNCDTACTGGMFCDTGTCACPPAFVPDNPTILQSQAITQIPGELIEFGGYPDAGGGGVIDALASAVYTASSANPTQIDTEYPLQLTDQQFEAPFLAAAYNLDLSTNPPTADAAVYATSGFISFTKICDGGFEGTAHDVHFDAVDSITNPVIIPDGCSFDVVGPISFSFGDVSCP